VEIIFLISDGVGMKIVRLKHYASQQMEAVKLFMRITILNVGLINVRRFNKIWPNA
jgi:hypothetical protein